MQSWIEEVNDKLKKQDEEIKLLKAKVFPPEVPKVAVKKK